MTKLLDANSPEITDFLKAWHENQRPQFEKNYTNLDYDSQNYVKNAKTRNKYIACDRGTSGMYLVDRETGAVYSIKSYGTPNRFLGGLLSITALFKRQTAAGREIGYPGYVGIDAFILNESAKIYREVQDAR